MPKSLIYVLELLGIVGLVGLISYISWTKMALGAALSLLGAFLPELHVKKNQQGEGTIDAGKVKVFFRGGLRFGVILAGLVLIIGAILDGTEVRAKKEEKPVDPYYAFSVIEERVKSKKPISAEEEDMYVRYLVSKNPGKTIYELREELRKGEISD